MAKTPIARALDKLFASKNRDGTRRFTIIDIHAARALLLLEYIRLGHGEELSQDRKIEAARLFDLIGIRPDTDPADMKGLVQDYFQKLAFNPEIWGEVVRIFEKYGKKGDRLEAMQSAEKAFGKLTEKESLVAPKVGEKAPENSEHAQTLTFKLGGKVRI